MMNFSFLLSLFPNVSTRGRARFSASSTKINKLKKIGLNTFSAFLPDAWGLWVLNEMNLRKWIRASDLTAHSNTNRTLQKSLSESLQIVLDFVTNWLNLLMVENLFSGCSVHVLLSFSSSWCPRKEQNSSGTVFSFYFFYL